MEMTTRPQQQPPGGPSRLPQVPDQGGGDVEFDGHRTMVALWAARCQERGAATCHREKKLGIWQSYSWTDWYEEAKAVGLALMDLGVQRGEPVLILAEDRREWLCCDLGAASIGAIPTGVYTTDSPNQLAYLANDSGARVLFVEDE